LLLKQMRKKLESKINNLKLTKNNYLPSRI
jgi:hypothetical protein